MSSQNNDKSRARLIEIGWVLAGRFSELELDAITQARDQLQDYLRASFPQFQWQLPLLYKPAYFRGPSAEAAPLLRDGLRERDSHSWDFALVLTSADLNSYYKAYTLAVPSQALAVAVVSLSRLAPQSELERGQPPDAPSTVLGRRLRALALHLLGDLNGVPHSDANNSVMFQPDEVSDLDQMQDYHASEQDLLAEELADIADVRLEEEYTQPTNLFVFYLRATWRLRDEIRSAVVQARPWEFPFRLSRLTTGALSTLLIMLMTAEAWEVGMSQNQPFITFFSLTALSIASIFILKRQKLLLRRSRRALTEQTVQTNVAISLVVLLGMLTTYLLLFALVLSLSELLFNARLVAEWVASGSKPIQLSSYIALSQLVASLGMLIGSLGASFEGQNYFQHIAYVDEEL